MSFLSRLFGQRATAASPPWDKVPTYVAAP